MKRYESYKDSGVKWLGEIPGHWEVIRLKALLIERIEKNNNKENLIILSLLKDKGIIPYDEKGAIGNNSKEDLSQYKIARKGDLVINSMNVIIGSVGITQYDGYISPAYYSFKPRGIINLIYYYYLMTLRSVQQSIRCYSKGIMEIRLRITSNDFLSMPFPFPPKSEQTAIANYLDSVTSKIDEAISQQQKMIDLLNERKQIIIQNAVTKGLDPNAKMKDSGVEWIGEIPENWEVRRLNSIGRFSKGGNISRDQLTEDGKCEAILYGDIYTKYYIKASIIRNHITEKTAMNSVRIKSGDILMTGSGETKEDIGKTIMFDSQIAYIGGDVILFRQNKMDSLFLSYALNSMYAKVYRYKESKGEIVVHIYSNALKSMKIAAPPMNEQSSIVKYLNRHFLQIDESITSCNKMISLLQERKQIIINDVVTGKVKVI
ncbi:MAG: restriction endonuclease subunit S [Prevotella sp.]|nr:restriction endonuclease subunit S [Prevotella sp.]MDY4628594.1 restriction endonuclease subunit S [Prevotella sp.]